MNLQHQHQCIPWLNKLAHDDEPLFHPVVCACRDIIMQALSYLGDGLVHELLKARDLIPAGIDFAQQKELGEKCHGAFLPG
jgi:hypothetical protein